MDKTFSLKQIATFIAIVSMLVGGSLLTFGQETLFVMVRTDTTNLIKAEICKFEKRMREERRAEQKTFIELMTGIPAVEAKAKEMREQKKASQVILEVLENR